ncbi:hypothetical protein LTR10_017895 [Elasticomyces elasticus]|uniref:NAD(P)-binding protein n=1 Tax=Exophiala sideris TaxID=1016849 RepID=A0ABR0IWU6_9EURO|nr:hypothetical protein LTR10_017895 [Elasticomyces elasticus]KAK5021814.1 hypothetical protein LTS07_010709 [Exophiala sideris]KAK5025828.1 hypothetical protein LTR13_010291 [Exophiala sideris]KAK5050192.1 hypothetical protein LTR69_010679 [Exophiala sideris]KAK5177051.1 hypothetical protein LTR44_010488 [Eurotiomycetes sp. CCFEE 6388]
MSSIAPRVILVTGANRGIGLAIIQALASHPQTTKDMKKGEEAIQELRSKGITSVVQPVTIDVTSDMSIRNAVNVVQEQHGQLDVLVNNAGYAVIPSASDFSDWRGLYAAVYDINVTSVALTMAHFLPLLRQSPHGGRVINVSSARGSTTLSSSGLLPSTVAIPYSVSKAALNLLTVEMSRDAANKDVEFQLVSPGHCKTALNNYRGVRDPLEGANVVVGLVTAEKAQYKNAGFSETKGASMDLVEIPW